MEPSTNLRGAPALVVSLHDVTQFSRKACARILDELSPLGAGVCSLLVIPNYHRRGHFSDDTDFTRWLREKAQAGHEMVIHGYFHERAKPDRETAIQRFITERYTAGEGEFYDMGEADAANWIARGRSDLESAGLDPRGFIAPAWLLSQGSEAALRKSGLDYTTRIGGVLDLRSGVKHASQSLVWSVRAPWRRAMSLAWNAALFQRMRRKRLVRISIHPVDIEHAAIWRQIQRMIRSAARTHRAITYDRWIAESRIPDAPSRTLA